MSFRLLSNRLAKHGRFFLQHYCKRDIFTNILEQTKNRRVPASFAKAGAQGAQLTARQAINPSSGIFRFGQHARKLLIDNILNRVTTTYSAELRTKATKKLFYGDSAPFFALIGVSLASGAGVLTKEDELEGVCWEIRDAALRLQNTWNSEEVSKVLDKDFNIDKLDVGPPIAKGCAAVVYAAAFKNDNEAKAEMNVDVDTNSVRPRNLNFTQQSIRPEMMSPIQNRSRFIHNFGGSLENVHLYSHAEGVEQFFDVQESPLRQAQRNSTRYPGLNIESQRMQIVPSENSEINRYPLAMKMMFNYDIQSNALSILRAMYKETVPARRREITESSEQWEKLIQDQTHTLPPHPNIVCMFGYFCGEVRNFRDGHILYPIAQPPRINPQGYGRNMSLYLLMKRYDHSLSNLLEDTEVPNRTRILLFTQLLEAVAHLSRHGIAHRDLKSDNILIEVNDDKSPPILVLSDFGCCLADKVNGLQIPYASQDVDKGGNAALMAPEIINKQPGTFAVLNYSKSDLWACGAIAYEIFGQPNPFYSSGNMETNSLKNFNYKDDDLPDLPDECPYIVQQLIYNILSPNPNRRVSPDIAANVMQLFLWAPSKWLKSGGMPSSPEILQWLLSLTTKVMCEGRNNPHLNNLSFKTGRRTYVEYLLICSFLARARLRRIRGALTWIQNAVLV